MERLREELLDTLDEELELELEDETLVFPAGGEHPNIVESASALPRRVYFTELIRLQRELVKLQDWVVAHKFRLVVVFEGRDAAGKGGVPGAHAHGYPVGRELVVDGVELGGGVGAVACLCKIEGRAALGRPHANVLPDENGSRGVAPHQHVDAVAGGIPGAFAEAGHHEHLVGLGEGGELGVAAGDTDLAVRRNDLPGGAGVHGGHAEKTAGGIPAGGVVQAEGVFPRILKPGIGDRRRLCLALGRAGSAE
ncbi:MAG: hypothetical protein M1436_10195 [Acidobacteria bacterium]|nr:hypothetical protein [Acidobacteriota bacterium]